MKSITLLAFLFYAAISSAAVEADADINQGVWSQPPIEYVKQGAVRIGAEGRPSIRTQLAILKNEKFHPSAPRLFATLGRELYSEGYFSDAIDCFQTGWQTYKDYSDPDIKMFADLCGAELSQMYARIGRMDDLKNFLDQNRKRDFIGQAGPIIELSQSGLGGMVKQPEIAFKCGPFSLESILRFQQKGKGNYKPNELIRTTKSPRNGFSLEEVEQLSNQVKLNYKAFVMEAGAVIPTPSVVHWKLDHYAAILEKVGNRYRVADPTFGKDLWVGEDALRRETSGYFLLPVGDHPGFKPVEQQDAKRVRGKGWTYFPDKDGTGQEDCTTCPEGPFFSLTKSEGMPTYSMHLLTASLRLTDTPISYSPPYGPEMDFTLVYNQRDAYSPVMYNVSSFGYQWSSNWISYMLIDVDDPNEVTMSTPMGGAIQYSSETGVGSVTQYAPAFGPSPIEITDVTTMDPITARTLPDGTIQVFEHKVELGGTQVMLMMSRVIDPHGKTVEINYDAKHRITSIVDAAGKASTFCYDDNGTGNCRPLIRSITDPYGRTAYFNYDNLYRLTAITDTLGLQTTFDYSGGSAFIESMTTPYGETLFEKESYDSNPDYYDRYIMATDPLGNREKVLAEQTSDYAKISEIYDQDHWPDPDIAWHRRYYYEYRNSFYWNKRAMATAPDDYKSATIYHFLHTLSSQTSRFVEHFKRPLEGPITFWYPGQTSYLYEPEINKNNKPSQVGRLLENGETQLFQFNYNSKGNMTEYIDPAGRRQTITYADNGIDPVAKAIEVDGVLQTVAQIQYDANRNPVVFTDAAGSQTTVTYHSTFGLPTSITNARNETVTIDYTTTGLLKKISQPDPANYMEVAYGKYDQPTSVTQFPEAYTLKYEFDVFDRLVRTTYPDNTSDFNVYDKLDLKAERDRLGRWSHYTYDANRRQTSYTNPANETIQYSWCGCGSLEGIIDAEGRRTAYDYDIQGRLTSQTLPSTPPTLYEYEALSGRLKCIRDPKGQKRNIAYDVDDTVIAQWPEDVAPGTASATPVYFSWDEDIKRLIAWGDGTETTTLSYYDVGVVGANKISEIDGPKSNDTTSYSYDVLGRLINSSDGTVEYDNLGRMTSKINPLTELTYSYAPHSYRLISKLAEESGNEATFSYGGAEQDFHFSGIENSTPFEIPLYFEYNYDSLGRITNWFQQNSWLTEFQYNWSNRYDGADRLVEVNDDALQFTRMNWRFDKAGNRLSYQVSKDNDVKRTAYEINDRDQVTSAASGGAVFVHGALDRAGKINASYPAGLSPTDTNGLFKSWIDTSSHTSATISAFDFSGHNLQQAINVPAVAVPSHSFEYDLNGNMTRKLTTATDGVTTSEVVYEWDSQNQLTAIVSGNRRSEFYYDGLGRRIRIKEIVSSITESDRGFQWDGLRIIAAGPLDGSGNLIIDKEYYEDGYKYDGDKFSYWKDHLGSVRSITFKHYSYNSFDYDVYGNPLNSTWRYNDPDFLYTGHYYHRPSGLYLAPYRVYDPEIGRWLSREPLGLDGPNLYHYGVNQPLSNSDPDGLQWIIAQPNPIFFPRMPFIFEEPPFIMPKGPGGGRPLAPDFIVPENGLPRIVPKPKVPDPTGITDYLSDDFCPRGPGRNFYNPKTKESLSEDDGGHGPHLDWQFRNPKSSYRLFRDGTWESKQWPDKWIDYWLKPKQEFVMPWWHNQV